ncbi:MAG TPA: GNAT family N-acetyltransferase [Clostridiales bacterium]|nr:GNAT family N-acetyltransferase [Clostridiales bacterium]
MPEILIRKYNDTDLEQVLNICHKTGYMGKDLEGTGEFGDRKLFGYFFCAYYLLYEKEHCFVAVDSEHDNMVVGYIIGTMNTKRQIIMFMMKMSWRIGLRLLYTFCMYPSILKSIRNMLKNKTYKYMPKNLYNEYPAHLHINMLPEYQGRSIGTSLLATFENHIKNNPGIQEKGIHLKTSNKNCSAIKFYIKNGYTKLLEFSDTLWGNVEDYKTIIFVKKL